jgi:hypothetical protein
MIRLKAALTARHSTPLAVLAVGTSFAMVALALALATARGAAEDEAGVERVQFHPELVTHGAAVRQRCTTCGVIEDIVVSEGGDGVTRSYEFAIRMQDGSLRHSSDTSPGRWQVGDGIQLLGGGRTWSER